MNLDKKESAKFHKTSPRKPPLSASVEGNSGTNDVTSAALITNSPALVYSADTETRILADLPSGNSSDPLPPNVDLVSVRFFFHKFGSGVGELRVYSLESDAAPHGPKFTELWRSYGNKGDTWWKAIVNLPNMTKPFQVHFVAGRGVGNSDIAIDDITLSPECFGIGVPENESIVPDEQFMFTTCGAIGRLGPNEEQCNAAYQNSTTKVYVMTDPTLEGIQKWEVPQSGLYTVFVKGAGGGPGVDNRGRSLGASLRATFDWEEGDFIYILVGQKGIDPCRTIDPLNDQRIPGHSGGRWPVLPGRPKDDSFLSVMPHGLMPNNSILPINGYTGSGAGGGGGWDDNTNTVTGGESLREGGRGGRACQRSDVWHTDGGFGGGGGGCASGGGGGGYRGGDASEVESPYHNGQGGTSYLMPGTIRALVEPGSNPEDGSVIIIPAQSGCGCDYLCVHLDLDNSAYYCICPPHLTINIDGYSCNGHTGMSVSPKMLVVIILSIVIAVSLGTVCIFFATARYRKIQRSRDVSNQPLNSPDEQLSRLRSGVVAGGMISENNPNYEFGGNSFREQDLKALPRENLTLVHPLGQGAFGEVYQGTLKMDDAELPVAVKNKPSPLTLTDLLKLAIDVAKGCQYLEENHFIHRSYGVLLWEVISLGYMPYPGRGNQEVMQLVTSGGRLEPPTNCPAPVYHIMMQCWHPHPDERPNFTTIIERLGYCMQVPTDDLETEIVNPKGKKFQHMNGMVATGNASKQMNRMSSIKSLDDLPMAPAVGENENHLNNPSSSANQKSNLSLDPGALVQHMSGNPGHNRTPNRYISVAGDVDVNCNTGNSNSFLSSRGGLLNQNHVSGPFDGYAGKNTPPDLKEHFIDSWAEWNQPLELAEKLNSYKNNRQGSKNHSTPNNKQNFRSDFATTKRGSKSTATSREDKQVKTERNVFSKKTNFTPERRTIQCYGCGTPGYIQSKCSTCSVSKGEVKTSVNSINLFTFESLTFPKSLIVLKIYGVEFAVCANTGASHSIAVEKLFHMLQRKRIKFESKTISLTLADGTQSNVAALTTVVNLEVEGKVIPTELIVLPEAKGNRTLLVRRPRDIREEQLKDEELKKIIDCFENNSKDGNFANWTSQGYLMNQGILYCYSPKVETEVQLVVPVQERERVLKKYYDVPTAGHYGAEGTYNKVACSEITPYLKRFAHLTAEIKDHVEQKQGKRKTYYDRRRRQVFYKQGDLVWVTLNPVCKSQNKKSRKFMTMRERPYLVITNRSPPTYDITDPAKPDGVLGTYYSSALRACELPVARDSGIVAPHSSNCSYCFSCVMSFNISLKRFKSITLLSLRVLFFLRRNSFGTQR
ncbi:ALK tyrosine kinase receptor like protein [Argiope bruennichi]|uniref:ALK tyrosine kinase receptor like protein n=1 Tax=Argiope bruennichi TaxID=94029 RepID=A0A8T0DZU6_ARGBR|nr:ALK tyrosine kinase receptor like protein [Argiope bruennichi]